MNTQSAAAFVSLPTMASASSTPLTSLRAEISSSGNKAGDRAMTSLWIQRLKLREDLESLNAETLVSDNAVPQGVRAGDSNAGSRMHPFGNHLQEASFTQTWGNKPISKLRKLDEKKAVSMDAVDTHVSSCERCVDDTDERQQSLIKQGQGKINPLFDPHTGGEQTNRIFAGAKSKRNLLTKSMIDIDVNSRFTSDAATTLRTCVQASESESAAMHAVRAQAAEGGILTSSLGKPPLPPPHNKPGLLASHKASGFLAQSAGKISSSKAAATSLQDSPRHLPCIADTGESLAATIDSAGPLLKEGRHFEEDGMGCQDLVSKENEISVKARRVLQIAKSVSFSQKVVRSVELGMQQLAVRRSEDIYSSSVSKRPKKIARQDFEAMDVSASGAECSKLNGLETSELALLKESSVLKMPSKSMVVSGQAEQTMVATTLSASTTARFPWEMFAGAAGPSRSARDEFVEVYNRARNELKNQRSSSLITKELYAGMENIPKFASGQALCLQDTVIAECDGRQTSEQQPHREILGKRRKVEGLDCVAPHEGAKATMSSVQILQKEGSSEKQDGTSFLAGDADMSLGKKSQAFRSIHAINGKESNPYMLSQSGGPLHGCVESLAAVGQKDCSLAFDPSLQCRQGFAHNTTHIGAASTCCRESFETAHAEDQTDRVGDENKKSLMLLSKRQLGMFDSLGAIAGKEAIQRIEFPRKSDAWLQRWYPPYIMRTQGLQEHKRSGTDRLGQSLASNMLTANQSGAHGACTKEARFIQEGALYQRIAAGERRECSKASALPSAAAMAIVGTAARQFCTVEPQQKGSFAFWSGFGMQTPRTREHFTEQGNRRLTFKADPSAKT